MGPQARLETTENGLVPAEEGWFVLNARDAPWIHAPGRSAVWEIEGKQPFPQLGINLSVLAPGESMAMYHWEADQEDFLVLAGEALLIVEGVERPLRAWDFVHCPAGAAHTPSILLAVGARILSTGPAWGAYTVDQTARRHGVGVEQETDDPLVGYEGLKRRKPTRYQSGWLPD
jgi:quercetin dioxygenase-like cupin family protein